MKILTPAKILRSGMVLLGIPLGAMFAPMLVPTFAAAADDTTGEPAAAVVTTEDAVLSTGFRIHADRHEIEGDRVVLYTRGGVTELPASSIDHFETVERAVPVNPAAKLPAPEGAKLSMTPASGPNAASTSTQADPRVLLRDAASRSGLPAAFVESVAKVESAFRPGAVSPKGAVGVMQLMPDTARAMNADPSNTEQNIEAGVQLLRNLLLRYDGDVIKALSAYNAGTDAVSKYGGVPPYPETQNYVDKVLRTYISNGGR